MSISGIPTIHFRTTCGIPQISIDFDMVYPMNKGGIS